MRPSRVTVREHLCTLAAAVILRHQMVEVMLWGMKTRVLLMRDQPNAQKGKYIAISR